MIQTLLLVVAGCLLLVLLLLLIPVRYTIVLEKWNISCQIQALGGLFHKELSFAMEEEKTDEPDADLMEELLQKAENAHGKTAESDEKGKKGPGPVGKSFLSAEETEEEDGPSLLEQLRFAMENGLLEKVFHAASRCLSHGWPSTWRIEGELGLGEPMETGILSGMIAAFFQKETQGIVWNYLDRVMALTGYGKGRVIPLYMAYIACRLLICKETRQFWHFRQGGIRNE